MSHAGGTADGWERVSASGLRRVYRLLCHIAHCDHELHPKERALLERYRTRFAIGEAEAATLEGEGKRKEIRMGRHPHEQHMLMWAMVDVAAADGRLERQEHKRLLKVAGAMGLPQAELVALIRRRFAHDRAGLAPRPQGVKTAVVDFRDRPPRRPVPDTLTGIPVPSDDALARPVPPTVGPVPAPLAAGTVPPTVGPIPAPLAPERSVPPTVGEMAAPRLSLPEPRGLWEEERKVPPTVETFARGPSLDPDEDYDPFARPGEEGGPPAASPGQTFTIEDELSTFSPFQSADERAAAEMARAAAGQAEVARRASLPTPVPLDPPTPAPQRADDVFGPGVHDTSLSLSPGTIVLLGVSAREVRIDLTTVPIGPEFRGFAKVPPGLHWLSVLAADGPTSLWVDLPGGGVVVKVYDQRTRRLTDPAPQTAERYRTLARGGGLGPGLAVYPYDLAVEWVELTVHLDPHAFPPGLHPSDAALDDGRATRLESAINGTHKGDGQAFLTELSWAFLAGTLERHPAALERWLYLLKACFEAEPGLLARDPAVAVLLVDLLVAQMQQMPASFFDIATTAGVADLADALGATGLPHLHEAADRLRAGFEAARRR